MMIKDFLQKHGIDYLLLPNSNEFFCEYLPQKDKIIEHLTGFTGSSATVVFGQSKSFFFTDGRYMLQAGRELDSKGFEVINVANKSLEFWLKNDFDQSKKLAIHPKLTSINFADFCQRTLQNLIFIDPEAFSKYLQSDEIEEFEQRIIDLPINLTGKSSIQKREIALNQTACEAILITKPENICWLLNIRGFDLEFTPLHLAYAIIFPGGNVHLISSIKQMIDGVKIIDPNHLDDHLSSLKINSIQIDSSCTNYWLYQKLCRQNFDVIFKPDPIEIIKAKKNEAEIAGMIKTHQEDAIAMIKFLAWLDSSIENGVNIDEMQAQEKLLEFRKRRKGFMFESFAAISGFEANGSVIHYRANLDTSKKLVGNSLYLIDSGGQYFCDDFYGTTDITRTIAIGHPSQEMIRNFTLVLKGHIAVASAIFPRGTSGSQLDILARQFLWQESKNYDHGTGHGVGAFLSVHEGPQNISKRSTVSLEEGMIISNEPGFYLDNQYGIRIENLLLVKELNSKFLHFKTISLAPIDHSLIDFDMLSQQEKQWLQEYHKQITNEVCKGELSDQELKWLEKVCNAE